MSKDTFMEKFEGTIVRMVNKAKPVLTACQSLHEANQQAAYYEGYTMGVRDALYAFSAALKEAKP